MAKNGEGEMDGQDDQCKITSSG